MKVHLFYLNIGSAAAYGNNIGILSAVLKKNGDQVSASAISDKNKIKETVKEAIAKFKPEIAGISVLTNQAKYVPEIVKTIRENSKAVIIAGGMHATIAPEDLKKKGIDYVFQGEAENSLVEFVNKLKNKEDPSKIRGIWPNQLANLPDLTKIPQEDKEILNFGDIIKKKNMWAGEVIATRGCPYECSYCCNSTLNDLYRKNLGIKTKEILRKRNIEHVIQEFKDMKEKYPGIKMFIFGDDTFTLDKDYCLKLLGEYHKNIEIPFVCNINLLSFDKDIAEALKKAGCYEIKIGIESGSERVRREILKRYITNAEIIRRTNIAHEAGLNISTFNMIGLPTETKEELMETIKLNALIKPHRMKFMIFYPYPLTPAFDICKKLDIINYEKLEELDNYQTDTPLKFSEDYMKLLKEVWNNLSEVMNKACNEEFYEMMPNSQGMVLKKGEYKPT